MRRALARCAALALVLGLVGCVSKQPAFDNPEVLSQNDEFESAIRIVVTEPAPAPAPAPAPSDADPSSAPMEAAAVAPVKEAARPADKKKPKPDPQKKTSKGQKAAAVPAPAVPAGPARHEPADVEDGEGFDGRRPMKDPFRVGETVVHDVNYNLLKISAGTLTMKVDPFVEVNGRRSYSLVTSLKTYPAFSRFVYSVDDKAVVMMDHELLVPHAYTLHVKESSQLREARSIFDFEKLQARFWEKKVTEKSGVEEKKYEWEILPYSQNLFSAIFYMRLFQWETGKEYAFRVADDRENHIFRGKALRRETLDTELGPMKSVVVKAEIMTKGVFKPVGDILIWLSDDDRKLVLRIECKIKIGTLVSEVIQIEPGREP